MRSDYHDNYPPDDERSHLVKLLADPEIAGRLDRLGFTALVLGEPAPQRSGTATWVAEHGSGKGQEGAG